MQTALNPLIPQQSHIQRTLELIVRFIRRTHAHANTFAVQPSRQLLRAPHRYRRRYSAPPPSLRRIPSPLPRVFRSRFGPATDFRKFDSRFAFARSAQIFSKICLSSMRYADFRKPDSRFAFARGAQRANFLEDLPFLYVVCEKICCTCSGLLVPRLLKDLQPFLNMCSFPWLSGEHYRSNIE